MSRFLAAPPLAARRNQQAPGARLGLVLAGICAWLTGSGDALAADLFTPGADAGRATLSGDWGGQRTEWAVRGIEIGIEHYGDMLVVIDGGLERGAWYAGLFETGVALDLDTLLGWQRTRVFVLGIGTFGRDPADGTGSIHAPSNLANVPTGKLLEAWLERDFLDGGLALLAGLYAADSEFDVKETAGVFMNGGFGTGLDLSETGLNGPCVYPVSCLGVRARYQPGGQSYFQLAVLDGVAGDPEQPRGTQIRLDSADGLLFLGELGVQRDPDRGRFLRAALGAWHYTTEFETLLQSPGVAARTRRGTQGLYALLEGDLYREPGQFLQGLSGFLRLGWADEAVNPIGRYAGAGLVYTGLFPGRDDDVLGVGISAAFSGDDFRAAQADEAAPVEAREVVIELAYWIPVLPWLSVQLDAQHVRNPGLDPGLEDATVLGLRYQVTF